VGLPLVVGICNSTLIKRTYFQIKIYTYRRFSDAKWEQLYFAAGGAIRLL